MTVVPYVGTWIEILYGILDFALMTCRSLRGNVDRNHVGVALCMTG